MVKLTESEQKSFNYFLQKMETLGVLKKEKERGEYSFTNPLILSYISLEANKLAKERE